MTDARTTRTAKKRDAFIEALSARGNVSEACKASGVARRTVYEWRDDDAVFAKMWDDALDQAADTMEREAWRRAVEGTDKPVFHQGQEVGAIREYSDTLLIFLLKAVRPEKYRERQQVEQSGTATIRVVYDNPDASVS